MKFGNKQIVGALLILYDCQIKRRANQINIARYLSKNTDRVGLEFIRIQEVVKDLSYVFNATIDLALIINIMTSTGPHLPKPERLKTINMDIEYRFRFS